MKKPLVSIALTTYNGAEFLSQQLDSFYAQSYKNIEVVACDDSSDDGTVKILEKYRKTQGLKFRVNSRRLGYQKNFEKAITLCRGEYIALSDQDDIWLPLKLETLVKEIGDYSLVCSDLQLIDENNRVFHDSYMDFMKKRVPEENLMYERLIFDNYFPGCSMMFHRSLIDRIMPIPVEAMHHDWWIAVQASLNGGIKYITTPLMQYRQHGKNTIGSKKFSGFKYTLDRLSEIFFNFRKRKMELMEKYRNLLRFVRYNSENSVYKDQHQRELLKTAERFFSSYLKGYIHLKTVYLGIRYGSYIYWPKPPLRRIIQALFKIV